MQVKLLSIKKIKNKNSLLINKFQKGVKIAEVKEVAGKAKSQRGFEGKMFESTAKKGVDAEKKHGSFAK